MISKTILHSSVTALALLATLQLGSRGDPVMSQPAEDVTWTFDRLENIGGHKTTVLGQPKVITSPIGKAVEFDGVDDYVSVPDAPTLRPKSGEVRVHEIEPVRRFTECEFA